MFALGEQLEERQQIDSCRVMGDNWEMFFCGDWKDLVVRK